MKRIVLFAGRGSRLKLLLFTLLLVFAGVRPAAADQIVADDSAYGKTIQSIEFDTPVNLSYGELMFGLPIRRTNRLRRGDLESAITALRTRKIFGDIIVIVTSSADDPNGIQINFDLQPVPTISDAVFRGYNLLDEQRLRRLAALRLGAPVETAELDAAVQRIKKGYEDYGIFSPSISYERQKTTFESMAVVEFKIDEGRQSYIGEVQFSGEFPQDVDYLRDRFIDKAKGTAATKSDIADLKQELLRALRQEGYLQASVEIIKSDYLLLTGDLRIDVKVKTKDPIGIMFVGNTAFTEKELLESLKIASRTVPFSPNAIQTLTREIVELYQSNGYYYAKAESTELPGMNGRRVYQINVYEGPQKSIGTITVKGNSRFTAEEILEKIGTRPAGARVWRRWSPGYLIQTQVDDDIQTINSLYAAAGYPGTKTVFEVNDIYDSDQLDIVVNVTEGEPELTKAVSIRFAPLRDGDESAGSGEQSEVVLQEIKPEIEIDEPLSQERIEKERLRILTQVSALGFPKSEVSANLDSTLHSLEFVVTAGPRVEVGTIYLAGNMFTRDFVVRREVLISSGGPWDRDLVRKSEQSLSSLGLFRSAEIRPLDGVLDGPVEDVVVTVSERESGNIDLGFAFDTEDGLHLSSRVGNRNFDGEGRDLVLGVDGYIKTGENLLDAGHLQATYRIPRAFDGDGDLYFEGFGQYSIQLINQYDYNRTGTGISYRLPVTERISATAGIREVFDDLYNVQPDVIIGSHDEGGTYYSFLHGQIEYENRDDIYNPRKGFRSQLQYNISSQYIGSDVDFVGATWKNSFYAPLNSSLVWANNVTLQALEPYGTSDTIPIDQRIFLGGRESLRGFTRYAIGPRGVEKDIAGGDRAVIFNTELQYQFAEDIVGVTFLDVGQSYLVNKGSFEGDPNSFGDLRYSPGLGFRYLTPIGPVSAEYGFALDREFGERFGRFTLSVGNAF